MASYPDIYRPRYRATNRKMSFSTTTLSEALRPQHIVIRPNGTMVPLIAADELPATISVRGVPRTMTPHDISGMTVVGTLDPRHRQYVVDVLDRGLPNTPPRADRSLRGSNFAWPDRQQSNGSVVPPKAFGIEEQPPPTPKLPSANTAPNTPKSPFANMAPTTPEHNSIPADAELPPFKNIDDLPIGRAPGIKEYCSYWLRHGECDYAQQGCLYRHEMPLDQETLLKLGLRDIPRWYREKHKLGSYLAGGNTISGIEVGSGSKPKAMERNWRNHPVEVLLDGLSRKPATNDPPAAPTEKPASDTRPTKPSTKPTPPKPAFTPLTSRHQPKPHSTAPQPAVIESMATKQQRETLRQLDAHAERELARKARLDEMYKPLTPQPSDSDSAIKAPQNTPSTSTEASSASVSGDGDDHDDDDADADAESEREAAKKIAQIVQITRTDLNNRRRAAPFPRQAVAAAQGTAKGRRGQHGGGRREREREGKGGKREHGGEGGVDKVQQGNLKITRSDARLVDHE